MEQNLVFGTLIITLVLFIRGRIRHDFVALIALFILILAGIVSPTEAFTGFGHPAVITVAAILIIGKALEYSGLIDVIGKWVIKVGKNITIQVLTLSLLVAIASSFMNNVGALAIMMPIAIHLARQSGNPPSYVLMPIAFASLLGGMVTLFGTPPNIIISAFRNDLVGEPFNMFDFAPVGIVLTILGIIYISLLGWRLLPKRNTKNSDSKLFDIDEYITEVEIKTGSKLIGKTLSELKEVTKADVQILGMVRDKRRIHAPRIYDVFYEDDIIILETDAEELKTFLKDTGTVLLGDKELAITAKDAGKITIMEAIVMADSMLVGQTASKIRMRNMYSLNLLAVARKEQQIHRRIDHVIFRNGDVLLLQGQESVLAETINALGCIPLAKRDLRLGYKTKIPLALSIFGVSVAAVITGFLPVQAAFSIAAVAMVLSGVLPMKEFYKSIDWPVIVLLGAMIPVGAALEGTGGAASMAGLVMKLGDTLPGWAILTTVLVVTMFLSDVINNAATVVLMAPIAIGVADGLGYNIDPFLMAVAVGGSSAFLTPIGHQSNTLVMGPGGYKFSDYWKMGLPLEIIIIVIGVPVILYFWPL